MYHHSKISKNSKNSQKKAPQTAAAYIRVSTEDQIEFSPDSQLKKIKEYAENHQILLLEHYIFIDEGISGRSAKNRPAFMEMIQTAKKKPKPFDIILVWKFSRFSRNRQDSIFYKSMLQKNHIQVISITEQLSDDPTSILVEALLEAMDEYYSINLAQEVRRGMNEKFSRGGVVNAPPFGYYMGKQSYQIDEQTAPIVQMIFEDFLKGMSCQQIAKKLNQMKIYTSRGNSFEARSIKYILQNPTYLGLQRRNLARFGEAPSVKIVPALHQPLISERTFYLAKERMQMLEKCYTRPNNTSASDFMLRGLVRCSCCGSTLVQSRRKKTLQCHKYAKGKCPESHSISIKKINTAVIEQIEHDFPDASNLTLHFHNNGEPVTQSFQELLFHIKNNTLSEHTKNKILHTFISYIIFFRKEGNIQIYYHNIILSTPSLTAKTQGIEHQHGKNLQSASQHIDNQHDL